MNQNKYLIYRHRRLSDGIVFYIGLGCCKSRAYSRSGRNKYWHNIVKKHGYIIEILKFNLSKEEAVELEQFLISVYGRLDLKTGILVNMTDGGDGTNKMSPESIEKRRQKTKGLKISQERKDHLSMLFKGRFVSDETKLKQSLKQIGDKNSFYNKTHTIETKNKMSKNRSGSLNHKSTIVVNLENGFFYDTIKEAALAYNLNKGTLSDYLIGKRKNKTILIKI